MCVVGVVQLSL